jgi:hypothetical protein
VHGGRIVNHKLAPQVGLFLKAFHKQFLGSGIELPVDVSCAFPGIVDAVFREFHRKAMEGAFMEAGDETFDNLPGKQLKVSKTAGDFRIDSLVQGAGNEKGRR